MAREGATPCQNGGTCVDSVGTYYCHCAEGYAGTSCAEEGEYKYRQSRGIEGGLNSKAIRRSFCKDI